MLRVRIPKIRKSEEDSSDSSLDSIGKEADHSSDLGDGSEDYDENYVQRLQ